MLRYIADVVTLNLDSALCNGCGICLEVCPHAVFVFEDDTAVISDRNACMECGACALNCETTALTVRRGVGCAEAVITGKLRGTEPTCDCSNDSNCC